MIVICDTSPITNLAAVEQLNLLQQLYSNIIIPQAVYDEMVDLDYAVQVLLKYKPCLGFNTSRSEMVL